MPDALNEVWGAEWVLVAEEGADFPRRARPIQPFIKNNRLLLAAEGVFHELVLALPSVKFPRLAAGVELVLAELIVRAPGPTGVELTVFEAAVIPVFLALISLKCHRNSFRRVDGSTGTAWNL